MTSFCRIVDLKKMVFY